MIRFNVHKLISVTASLAALAFLAGLPMLARADEDCQPTGMFCTMNEDCCSNVCSGGICGECEEE